MVRLAVEVEKEILAAISNPCCSVPVAQMLCAVRPDDLSQRPLVERKRALTKLLIRSLAAFNTSNMQTTASSCTAHVRLFNLEIQLSFGAAFATEVLSPVSISSASA